MKKQNILLICAVLISCFSNAQWVSSGPGFGSGYVNAITVDGTNIWAGCQPNFFTGGPSGVNLSTDNGNTWLPKNTGFTDDDIREIAVNGSTLVAASYNAGLWISTNSGASWAKVGGTLNNVYVRKVAIIANKIFAGNGSGLYVSTDNGSSWALVGNGLPASNINSIAVSGTTMYVNSNGAIYSSTNSGATWATQSSSGNYFDCMAIKGTNVIGGTSGSGVYLSTNNGVTWTTINGGVLGSKTITSIATTASAIYVGLNYSGCVYFSTNNGTSWQQLIDGFPNPTTTSVYALAISGSTILAGENHGMVYKRAALVGIEELNKYISVKVFPNPFTSQTTINLNDEYKNVTIRIIHALGKEIRSSNFSGKQFTIEREELKNGMYFIQLVSEDKIIANEKIIIN